MKTTKIAIPCHAPGGLLSDRSEHFGHCDSFTLIVIANGRIKDVEVIENIAHDAGGCMRPIELLKENEVDTIIVSGMGARPLRKFAEVGITVYFAPKYYSDEVYSVVKGFIQKEFLAMLGKQTCRTQGKFHLLEQAGREQKTPPNGGCS